MAALTNGSGAYRDELLQHAGLALAPGRSCATSDGWFTCRRRAAEPGVLAGRRVRRAPCLSSRNIASSRSIGASKNRQLSSANAKDSAPLIAANATTPGNCERKTVGKEIDLQAHFLQLEHHRQVKDVERVAVLTECQQRSAAQTTTNQRPLSGSHCDSDHGGKTCGENRVAVRADQGVECLDLLCPDIDAGRGREEDGNRNGGPPSENLEPSVAASNQRQRSAGRKVHPCGLA